MKSIIFKETDSVINPYDFEDPVLVNIDLSRNTSIDTYLDQIVSKHLENIAYNNILIPLTFGNTLSDYLGLRFALHIRTTKNINQNKNIYIYGFESINNLIKHPLFTILTTKGVNLVDYSLQSLKKYVGMNEILLSKDNLPEELKKINLSLPTNLYDNHSIANIWGVYRLIEIEGLNKEDFPSLKNNDQLKTVYFKWLLAVNEISKEDILDAIEDTRKFKSGIEIKINPVLYKIDLDKYEK